jgi:hypothetical protein
MNNEQTSTRNNDTALESMLNVALERAPQPKIPAGFAARVTATAIALPQRSPRRRADYGRGTALAVMVVLTATLFVLAPHTSPNVANLGFQVEMLVLLQLGGIGYWMMKSRHFSL